MLSTGLGTRLAALGLAIDVIGAIIATARFIASAPIALALPGALLLATLFLFWVGPGAWAVDARLRAGSSPE